MISAATSRRGPLRGSLAIGMAFGVGLLVFSGEAESQASPKLVELSPASVVPSRPVDLVLLGENFAPGAKVLIETGSSGRFVAYRATGVESERIELSLPLGFPRSPVERRIFVRNPDGSQSTARVLTIRTPEPSDSSSASAVTETSDPVSAAPDVDADRPVVTSIWPQPLPAGQARAIEVIGRGFEEGAEVLVSANVHAGSRRLPEYELRAFSAQLIDEQTLEVRFDRGFFHTPAVRELVVINPDGGRSQPALLRLSEPTVNDMSEE